MATTPVRAMLGHDRMLDWFFLMYWAARGTFHKFTRHSRVFSASRIGIVSMWDENQASLGEVTAPNKAAYCCRHGYSWLPQTAGFVAARPIAWSKIYFLRQLLPQYDWLMWSDVDSLITNPAIALEHLVDQPADLLITRDHIGVNSGSFLLRNTAWSRSFLDALWDLPSQPEYQSAYSLSSDRMWENRAFMLQLRHPDSRRHARIIPQRQLNSYHPALTPAGPASAHRPGDFVLHLPGMDNPTRLQILSAYARDGASPV